MTREPSGSRRASLPSGHRGAPVRCEQAWRSCQRGRSRLRRPWLGQSCSEPPWQAQSHSREHRTENPARLEMSGLASSLALPLPSILFLGPEAKGSAGASVFLFCRRAALELKRIGKWVGVSQGNFPLCFRLLESQLSLKSGLSTPSAQH